MRDRIVDIRTRRTANILSPGPADNPRHEMLRCVFAEEVQRITRIMHEEQGLRSVQPPDAALDSEQGDS
jgi:hypothetical protein